VQKWLILRGRYLYEGFMVFLKKLEVKKRSRVKEYHKKALALWFFFFLVTFLSLYQHKEKKVT